MKPYGLSKLHAFYLIVLYNNIDNGFKLNDFNTSLGCDKANTSRAIANLMEKNIICKVSEECEKKYLVKLTTEGIALAKNFVESVQEKNYQLLSVFSNDEQIEFYRLLKKIAEGVENDTNKKYC